MSGVRVPSAPPCRCSSVVERDHGKIEVASSNLAIGSTRYSDTMVEAKVITDSVNELGDRLTTLQVVCHRFVLAEFNTHRVFSRNSASSRAIPVTKQLERIRYEPARPLEWPAEQPGMQGGSELTGKDLEDAQFLWDLAGDFVTDLVEGYLETHPEKSSRLHKSLINRLLEPFMWHTICVSSTEWENFFAQRCSPLAQPEIRSAAEAMRRAIEQSTPRELDEEEWHLPYMDEEDIVECDARGFDQRFVSAARCARTSYLTQEGTRDLAEDVKLFERLRNPGEGPPHASPLEHVATPDIYGDGVGNFKGWHQLRHEFFG